MTLPVAIGPELIVNTTTQNEQTSASAIELQPGLVVAVWMDRSGQGGDSSGASIRAQLYAGTTKEGAELLLNDITVADQTTPALAAMTDGRFVVAWTDASGQGGDTQGLSVRVRIFNADGTPTGPSILAHPTTAGNQSAPSLVTLGNNRFVLTWTDDSGAYGDASGSAVLGRIFEPDGVAVGDPFLVNTQASGDQSLARITTLTGGGFVVTWQDGSGDGSGSAIRAQVFDHRGLRLGEEIMVNSSTLGNQVTPAVSVIAGNRFVVTWVDEGGADGDGAGIRARVFSNSGVPLGEEFAVNQLTSGSQSQPSVSLISSGRFVISWTDESADGSADGVFARVFEGSGIALGDQFAVNATTQGAQNTASSTFLSGGGGRFLVTWTDHSQAGADVSQSAIAAQAFSVPVNFVDGTARAERLSGTQGPDLISGQAGNDTLLGLLGYDTLMGGEGNDRLEGGRGNDVLDGGTGADLMLGGEDDDRYLVDNANDRVIETVSLTNGRDAGGIDRVHSTVNWTLGQFVENLFLAGSENLKGTGNSLSNSIDGNSGHNLLRGMGGHDTLSGGSGNDTLVGGAGFDSLFGHEGSDWYEINAGSEHTTAEIWDSGTGAEDRDVVFFFSGIARDTLTLFAEDKGIEDVLVQGKVSGLNLNVDARAVLNSLHIIGDGSANRLLGTASDDTIQGMGGNDSLDGGGGDDYLLGGAGNDTLQGGAGADTMDGGTGNDTYHVDHSDDWALETVDGAAGGIDTVIATIDWELASGIERLNLSGSAVVGIGNALNNTLAGNDEDNELDGGLGNDTLWGGLGDDLLVGGLGMDAMYGGAGDDLYHVDNAEDKVLETRTATDTRDAGGVDTVVSSISYRLPNFVEILLLDEDAGDIRGTGNALDNFLFGNDGSNTLDGSSGNDTLIGGAGADSLIGGAGNDWLFGEDDDDTLVGGAGDDLMDGGKGWDWYYINAASEHRKAEIYDTGENASDNDAVVFRTRASGETLTLFADDKGIETVYAWGSSSTLAVHVDASQVNNALYIGGNDGANRLIGTAYGDIIEANKGNDTLNGGMGADTLKGGDGNDLYLVDDVNDIAIEFTDSTAGGIDTVQSSVSWTLGYGFENLVLSGIDNLSGSGNELANRITGNVGSNLLSGGDGKDTITGAGGHDTLVGGAGADTFRITAALDASKNVASIGDFETGVDTIALENAVFTRLTTTGKLNTGSFRVFTESPTTIGGLDANDHILYDQTTGHLYYDRDGSGSAAAILFGQVAPETLLKASDFLIT